MRREQTSMGWDRAAASSDSGASIPSSALRHPKDPAAARRRALRAARVVTLGLALAGCSSSHEPMPEVPGVVASDAAVALDAALASDAGEVHDAGAVLDAGAVADAGHCGDAFGEEWEACCVARDWDPNAGCIAWGPYVPPGATMPRSRASRENDGSARA